MDLQELEAVQKELVAQGWEAPVQPAAASFQPFKWKMDMTTDTIAIGLVDDRYGHHILVLVARVQVRYNQAACDRNSYRSAALFQEMRFSVLDLIISYVTLSKMIRGR